MTFTDSVGGPLANTDLTVVQFSYFPTRLPGLTINNRLDQDVLGVLKLGDNDVTISPTADLVWSLQPADTERFIQEAKRETHDLVIRVEYLVGAATEIGIHRIRFMVASAKDVQSFV